MENNDFLNCKTPKLPQPGKKFVWECPESGQALWLAELKESAKATPFCIVCNSAQNARALKTALAFFAPHFKTAILPDSETLPYDPFSPHPDLISEKLKTLWQMSQNAVDFLIIPAAVALQRLAPPTFLSEMSFFLKTGQRIALNAFRQRLQESGYAATKQVIAAGEYALRGAILDVFPMGSSAPFRLDLFDDEIESIRLFDVETQRSVQKVAEINILPAHEFPTDDAAIALFRANFRENFNNTQNQIYQQISKGFIPAGIEYYLPLFFNKTATIFDYILNNSILFLTPSTFNEMSAFYNDLEQRFSFLENDRPILKPEALFLKPEDFFKNASNFGQIILKPIPCELPEILINRRLADPLKNLSDFKNNHEDDKIFLFADSLGRQEIILSLLNDHHLNPTEIKDFKNAKTNFNIATTPIEKGFAAIFHGKRHFFFTESELYASTRKYLKKSTATTNMDLWLKDLTELKIGDAVVHESHGVGRYAGLVKIEGNQEEFLKLLYADNAVLLVPVTQLQVISRYGGTNSDSAPLNHLGNDSWDKARRRAAQKATDVAAELLLLYAKRQAQKGHAFAFDSKAYERFAADFAFDETPDQARAIAAVLSDMASEKPMDRLICGDVGFGKTEVALRAAFCAVLGGKQVAILCPTTLLCEQHFQTFIARFQSVQAEWPVKIAQLSRFKSAKESQEIISALKDGTLDIVIGTHKLIGDTVAFRRLGLIVIDEEHRFGVKQKEKLKKMRADVDILTLTATPIPRTLAMSMEGLRDFSIIACAPDKRLAIKTFVLRHQGSIMREAILRELKRGGQVYVVHNDVKTIADAHRRLEKLVPEAKIVVGHGQMRETELSRVMRDFTAGRANVLLSSTIIETGLDNPHANTILIERAENFGLAQLHQLRGRVGRSHHQAYAYLLIDDEKNLKRDARQRLEAIAASDELGAGFYLAMQDLEIRGAGEILGENQSGEMADVGFELYNQLLLRAVENFKNGKQTADFEDLLHGDSAIEINLHLPTFLPEDFCPDINERLRLYKRLASAENNETLEDFTQELIDRFGKLPSYAQNLCATHQLRIFLKPFPIQKLEAKSDSIRLQFSSDFSKQKNTIIDPAQIIFLIQNDKRFKLAGQDQLRFIVDSENLEEKITKIHELFKLLTQKPNFPR